MKNSLLGFVLAVAVTGVVASPMNAADTASAKSPTFYSNFKNEAVAINLPGWTMAQQMVAPDKALLQFIPTGSDPKTPTTLINVVTYLGINSKVNARTMAKNEQANTSKVVKQGTIDFKFLDESNPNDVLYTIALSGNNSFPDQFEVHRILNGKDGLHTIIYHVQPSTQSQSRINEMIEMVKSVKLVAPVKQAK